MGIKQKTTKHFGLLALIIAAIVAPMLYETVVFAAPTFVSPNYGIDEYTMGSGGANDMSSASYRGRASLGDTGVGNSPSTNYQANSGFTTTPDPYIEFTVSGGTVDLGTLSTSAAKTGTATFSVRTYLASGYVVVTGSDPPNNGARILAGMSSAAASSTGTEQFGINLVANTSPATIGANPSQIPGSTYSFGTAAAGYNTANQYKYVKGDVIASSSSSSGTTQYTITYLININATTPGGQYAMNHIHVATSTY